MAKSLHLFMLLLYVLQSTLATKFSSSLSHDDECSLLFQFKSSMFTNRSASFDPLAYSKVASWKLNGSDCCSWDGVECTRESSHHVIALDLSSSFLYGPINSNTSLFNLIHLRKLNLADNDFRLSRIPSEIGCLQLLEHLDLSNSYFSGTLPRAVSNLTLLTFLNLGYNNFLGPIPSLASLSKLSTLILSSNKFNGRNLVDWVGKLPSLSLLDLIHNNLSCEIPSSIGNQTQLRELNLQENGMVGEIPPSLMNLTHLEYLTLTYNKFTGPIPPFPSTVIGLDLRYNQLSGPIPSSLSNLKNLNYLFLNENDISGTVEFDMFLSLKKLKRLLIGGNSLTVLSIINNHTNDTLPKFELLGLECCNLRVFPYFLQFQDQLHELFLDDNKIEGLIPQWMENVGKETMRSLKLRQNSLTGFEQHWPVLPWVGLLWLDLSHNMLNGSIPVPPSTTKIFLVSDNSLTGEIPTSMCDLQSLKLLDFSSNNITGSIPPCLEKIIDSLLVLNLRKNTLRGTIPNIFTKGNKLLMIGLNENKLEGRLPRSLKNCSSLQILDLGNNHLEDKFPFWLGALSKLQVLILRSNKFHGAITIPSNKTDSKFPKLRIVDLSRNLFSGDLPQQYFQEWSSMKETKPDATYMQTTVYIPYTNQTGWIFNYSYTMEITNKGVKREYEKIINILIAVDLSSNKFGGMIPESIKSLSGLQLLNISNNELSGVIPSSMGKLTQLEALDLSNNKLSGMIPQEFLQLKFVSFINVSCNNLDGRIPQGGQFNTFTNISYKGNLALCGEPLSKKCGNSELSKPPAKVIESNFPSGVDWVVILTGVGTGLVIGVLFGGRLTTRCYNWFLKK